MVGRRGALATAPLAPATAGHIWQCAKDTFTGVTKKHCGIDTYIKCVIAQCAEMCLHGYVVKTHFIEAVQRKSLIFCV